MYWYVLVCTCTVQGDTRKYKVVQGGTWRYKERYKEVQDSTRTDEIVRAGTYWYLLILTIQPGYAALRLDSLLQISPAD